MMTTDPVTEKQRIRRAMRELLRQIPLEYPQSAGASIAERLAPLGIWQAAERVAIFASRPDEIDTRAVWVRARNDGKAVLLPRLADDRSLEFAAAVQADLVPHARYGILEPPPESPSQALSQSDLVLVPGIAFDRQGGRLGRGGGYYDRTFARFRLRKACPILIGVGFSFQIVDRVPMTALDVRMAGILSERDFVLVGEAGPGVPK